MKDRKRFSFLGIPRQRRFVFSDTLALVQHSLAPLTGTARLHAELMHKQKEGSYELPTTNRICLPIISLILSNTKTSYSLLSVSCTLFGNQFFIIWGFSFRNFLKLSVINITTFLLNLC